MGIGKGVKKTTWEQELWELHQKYLKDIKVVIDKSTHHFFGEFLSSQNRQCVCSILVWISELKRESQLMSDFHQIKKESCLTYLSREGQKTIARLSVVIKFTSLLSDIRRRNPIMRFSRNLCATGRIVTNLAKALSLDSTGSSKEAAGLVLLKAKKDQS